MTPFDLAVQKNPQAAKAAALQVARSKAPTTSDAQIIRYIPPAECTDKIRIEFDDSGSMHSEIPNAKRGVQEFLRNCIPNQTAVAVHFMNTHRWSTDLRSDLPQLAADILETEVQEGGTPFFNILKKMLEATPKLTRAIVFTDGSPTDYLHAERGAEIAEYYSNLDNWIASTDIIVTIAKSIGAPGCIPIDTVFFGSGTAHTSRQRELLKYLSDATGGYFLHFDPQKMNFSTGFKYLAPVNRLQLASESFRSAVEDGRVS